MGADYLIFAGPVGGAVSAWDATAERFVPLGPVAYEAAEYDDDRHVVGVALADLGVEDGPIRLAVRQFDIAGGGFDLVDSLPDAGILTVLIGDVPGPGPTPDPDPIPDPDPTPDPDPDPIQPDRFEPNNDPANGTRLSSGTFESLSIVGADEDWFLVDLQIGETLVVEVVFEHDDADVDVRVFAPDGTVPGVGLSETDNESVSVVPAIAGTYAVLVNAHEDRGAATYDLTVRIESTQPSPQPGPGPVPDPDPAPDPVPDDGDRGVTIDQPIPGTGSDRPPIDHDGDGLFEDVDGDGQFTFVDVISAVFALQASDRINADPAMRDALNFDGQGEFTFVDVIDLVFRLST
jgi:hypothetical protein